MVLAVIMVILAILFLPRVRSWRSTRVWTAAAAGTTSSNAAAMTSSVVHSGARSDVCLFKIAACGGMTSAIRAMLIERTSLRAAQVEEAWVCATGSA